MERNRARIVSTWLRRSYPLPIRFAAWVDSETRVYDVVDERGEDLVLDVVVKEIADAVKRWGVMELELPCEYARRILLAITENGGTPCSRLGITLVDEYPGEGEVPLSLPNIPEIRIGSLTPLVAVENKMDLTCIRSLHINSLIDSDSGIRIIAACPNLEKLRLSVVNWMMAYRGYPVVGHKLFSVHLQFHQNEGDIIGEGEELGGDITTNIFQNFTAPSLRALILMEVNGASLQVHSVLDFLTRSRCQLERFHYDCRTSDDLFGTFFKICTATPSIKFLDICIMSIWSQFTRFLAKFRNAAFLPLLESCTFEVYYFSYEERVKKPLRDFMVARCSTNDGKLRKATLLMGHATGMHSEKGGGFSGERKSLGVDFSFKLSNNETRACEWD